MSHIFSVWLSMDEPVKSYLSQLIKQLCYKYNAVPFEPHLTLVSGTYVSFTDIKEQLDYFVESFSPVVLTIQKINYTKKYFNTLFIEFESSELLHSLHEKAKSTFKNTRSKLFLPHISLLYKNIHSKEKKKIARSIDITFKQICLNQVKIVTPKQNDMDWCDVENWHILYESSVI
jgi:2'-5' RNA ligase